MAKLEKAKLCDFAFDANDCLLGTCCVPCVYASAFSRTCRASNGGADKPEGLFPDTGWECAYFAAYFCLTPIVHPVTGIYMRLASDAKAEDENTCYAVLGELLCCGLCCLTCKMNKYRTELMAKTTGSQLL